MTAQDNSGSARFQEHLARRARPVSKMRVLAVDDDTNILDLLQATLTDLGGCDITVAESADAAKRIIARQQKPFDCLLLDIQMPGQNGISLCRELRELPAYGDTPMIMLTAMSERSYVDQAFAAGATDYVTKPFDFLELKGRIGAAQKLVMERRRAAESIAIAHRLKEELEASVRFGFEEPILLPKTDRLIGYSEFNNYVAQLSRGKLFYSYVTAVKILDGQQLHASNTAQGFRNVLADVARALSNLTAHSERIISYRGGGLFLVVCHGKGAPVLKSQEARLNQVAATLQGRRRAQTRFALTVGDRIAMRSLSRSGVVQSLANAIDSVDDLELFAEDLSLLTPWVLRSGRDNGQRASLDRQAYERALRDLMRDDPGLGLH